MKIEVNINELDEALAQAARIASGKSVLAVLSHIRFTAASDRLELSATNLEVEYFRSIACTVKTPGSITLPAKDLSKMVSKLAARGGVLWMESEENNWVGLKTKGFAGRLGGGHSDDFPEMTDTSKIDLTEISATGFIRGLRHVFFCASQDDSRENIKSVYIKSVGDKTLFAATDGHRLARCHVDIKTPFPDGFILPLASAKALLETFKNGHFLRVGLQGMTFVASTPGATLCGRLMEATYPDFSHIIKSNMGRGIPLTVGHRELVDAISLVVITASRLSKSIRLTFESGNLNIYGSDADTNKESFFDLPTSDFSGNAKIAVNHAYLLEAINALSSETVTIEVTDTLTPIFIQPDINPDDVLYVVMPMRL